MKPEARARQEARGGRLSPSGEFERSFYFDGIIFMPDDYAAVKALFDACHQRDNTTLTLKQSAAATPVSD